MGAGYDADGNLDLVFLAWVFGPTLADGDDTLSTLALRQRIDAWIVTRFRAARDGEGPRALVDLVAQMASVGNEKSLLSDSRVIAESAWLQVLLQSECPHSLHTVVRFLDGERFRASARASTPADP